MEKDTSEVVLIGDSFTTGYFNNTPVCELLTEVTDTCYTTGGIYLYKRKDLQTLELEKRKNIILFALNVEVFPRPILKLLNFEIHPKYFCHPTNKGWLRTSLTTLFCLLIRNMPACYRFERNHLKTSLSFVEKLMKEHNLIIAVSPVEISGAHYGLKMLTENRERLSIVRANLAKSGVEMIDYLRVIQNSELHEKDGYHLTSETTKEVANLVLKKVGHARNL